jgi:hypothetical protein
MTNCWWAPQIKHNWESIHPCSQIAKSPQHVLSVLSVCSASVVILIWRLCQNIISGESIHPAPQYRFQTSLSEWSDVLQRKTMDCFSSIFFLSFQDYYAIVLDELVLEVCFIWGAHQQFVMRCGFLLVEGCMVTCLIFNSEDYSGAICWLFTPYLILFQWKIHV